MSDQQGFSVLILSLESAKILDHLINYYELINCNFLGVMSLDKKMQYLRNTSQIYFIDSSSESMTKIVADIKNQIQNEVPVVKRFLIINGFI